MWSFPRSCRMTTIPPVLVTLCAVLCLPLHIECALDCTLHNVSYSVCDLMFWTQWTICNGVDCPIGQRQRFKSICCERRSKNETRQVIKKRCMNSCHLTENDFKDHSPYIPHTGMFNTQLFSVLYICTYPCSSFKENGEIGVFVDSLFCVVNASWMSKALDNEFASGINWFKVQWVILFCMWCLLQKYAIISVSRIVSWSSFLCIIVYIYTAFVGGISTKILHFR
jgi:hypothetical protein